MKRKAAQALGWLSEFGVLIFCFSGVLSRRMFLGITTGDITMDISQLTVEVLIGSGLLALVIVWAQDRKGDRVGKRKQWFRRAQFAFLWGMFSTEILAIVAERLQKMFGG